MIDVGERVGDSLHDRSIYDTFEGSVGGFLYDYLGQRLQDLNWYYPAPAMAELWMLERLND